jgi:prepilin-type processing-associated H-X9-DG protein
MRFRLWTILWVFALLASAMATFGGAGIFVGPLVVGLWLGMYRMTQATLAQWAMALAVVAILIALLLPALQAPRGNHHPIIKCMNDMKMIAIGLHLYDDTHGSFPASAQTAPEGEQPQSWRLWICAALGERSFLDNYDTDEAWDGPNNKKLVGSGTSFYVYDYPSDDSQTRYLAIVGEHAAFVPGRGRRLEEFTDGPSNTILFIEAPRESIPWTKPEDLTFDEAVELLSNPPKRSHYGHEIDGGFFHKTSRAINVAFADGRVRIIRLPISKEHATALLTVDGGEKLDTEEVVRAAGPELDYGRIYSLTLFLLLSLLPLAKLIARKREIAVS